MHEVERLEDAVEPDEAPDESRVHEAVRTLLTDESAHARTRRLKVLLARVARAGQPADLELLDSVLQDDRAAPAVRDHVVALLLRKGFPHALRVTPEALADFRARGTRLPVWSLGVLGLYALAELALIGLLAHEWLAVGALAGFSAHLVLWASAVAGSLLAAPFSKARKWFRRFLGAVIVAHPVLLVLAAALEEEPRLMVFALAFVAPACLAGLGVIRRSIAAEQAMEASTVVTT